LNDAIVADPVRLVDVGGEPLGIVSLEEARAKAASAGLDLVEIVPTATPPVCKILDYGKFRYEEQRKKADARKKQRTVEVKEIKLRPGIGDNDFLIKMNNVKRFLKEGDKVKITLMFRGREMSHQEYGMKVLERAKAEILEICRVEYEPRMEGRQVIMIVAPK
jgi:translation initiation factor IF-3